jgi:translation initiation factor 1 (eIF-1/SUI1)
MNDFLNNTTKPQKQETEKINMNDILVKKVTDEPDPSVLNKKIEMRHVKDGKAYRTFVFNLEHFIKEKQTLNTIINGLKKTLGTSCAYKETEFGFGYGFAGDCATKIKYYLINKNYAVSDNFK